MKSKKVDQLKVMEEKMPSMIHLTEKELPSIKDWNVGKSYSLNLKVKQKSKSEGPDGMSASFEIEEATPEEID